VADQPETAEATTPSSGSPRSRPAALVSRALHWLIGVPRLLLIGFLMLYRALISPLYGQTCRFYPSCSQYALTAVQRHGAVRGSWLAGRRLLRCHPWNPGGIDHVPPVRSKDGCEHEVTSSVVPAQAHPPASHATESESSESQADRGVAPTDQNCAPSVPRRAA
jgi:uncharacterized protein